MRGGLVRRRRERVDHVLRRPNLGIPAPKIDERLPVERRGRGNASQQRGEVLLRKTLDPIRRWSHRTIVLSYGGRPRRHSRRRAVPARKQRAPAPSRRRPCRHGPRTRERGRARGRRRRSRIRACARPRPPQLRPCTASSVSPQQREQGVPHSQRDPEHRRLRLARRASHGLDRALQELLGACGGKSPTTGTAVSTEGHVPSRIGSIWSTSGSSSSVLSVTTQPGNRDGGHRDDPLRLAAGERRRVAAVGSAAPQRSGRRGERQATLRGPARRSGSSPRSRRPRLRRRTTSSASCQRLAGQEDHRRGGELQVGTDRERRRHSRPALSLR